MKRVLVFGNIYLEHDTLAVTVAKSLSLPGIIWKHSENLNDLLEEEYDAILDVAYGIPRVVLLEDIGKLREHKLVSLHDYDVAFFLKLMKAMGKIEQVKIIAIPVGYDETAARKEVKALLESLKS